jgi:hypothetical protein
MRNQTGLTRFTRLGKKTSTGKHEENEEQEKAREEVFSSS